MKTALILHGTYGSPEINWFPWLRNELENLNVTVYVPQLPTPEGQTIENYLQVMDQTITKYNQDTLLIGHSSAPLAICAKLQQLDKPIQAAFLIAPFLGDIGNHEYDKANRNFNQYDFDWDKVKQDANKFYIYRSDNDPYVPQAVGKRLAEQLQVEETIIPGGGHLTSKAGFDTFPRLLADIRQEIINQDDNPESMPS
jgi:hypothetical protein